MKEQLRKHSKKFIILGAIAIVLIAIFLIAGGHERKPVTGATTMKLGVHEDYQGPYSTTLEKTLLSFPRIDVAREFESGPLQPQDLVKRLANHCRPMWSKGVTAVWSFKPLPADVRSGAWKPYVTALGKYVSENGLQAKTVIVIWHEPENDVPKYFKSPTDFVSVFNTVHEWLMAVDPNITTSHAALGYRYHTMTDKQAAQWVTKATIHSIDIYSGRSFPLSMTLGTSKAFARWKATRPPGARWGVSERGWIATSALSQERAASIDAEAAWLAGIAPAERPDFYIVWNTPGTENDPTLPLDVAGTAAVNRLFDRLRVPPSSNSLACPLCSWSGVVEPGSYAIVRIAPSQAP